MDILALEKNTKKTVLKPKVRELESKLTDFQGNSENISEISSELSYYSDSLLKLLRYRRI